MLSAQNKFSLFLIDREKKKMQVIFSGSEILKFNKLYKRHNALETLINSLDF
jgi:hypothetical protein